MLVKLEEFLMKDVTKICENLPNDDTGALSLKREFDVILEQRNEAIEALAAEKAATPVANNNAEEKKEASKRASIRKEASKKMSIRKEAAATPKKQSVPTISAAKSPQVDRTQKED
uniref:Uncharacterized protein n=1 Tax=Panagrolaimus sp. ES5 TaxID=591445 RepID=A0AC34G8E6_9BILA